MNSLDFSVIDDFHFYSVKSKEKNFIDISPFLCDRALPFDPASPDRRQEAAPLLLLPLLLPLLLLLNVSKVSGQHRGKMSVIVVVSPL